LTLLRAERADKILEVRIATIAPVELAALARKISRGLERCAVPVGGKKAVQRRRAELLRKLLGRREQAAGNLAPVPAPGYQEPRPGRGRERDRRDELRVVLFAGALVGVGPAPVEDELSERIEFHVERQ